MPEPFGTHPGRLYLCGRRIPGTGKDGRVVYADDVTARRILLRMGMVFQSFNLFPHMTVLDNILAAPVYVKGMKREDVIPAADALLDKSDC